MDAESKEDLLARVQLGVVLMRSSHNEVASVASREGQVKFAVVVMESDGTGRVGATFDAESFLDDIQSLIDLAASKGTA